MGYSLSIILLTKIVCKDSSRKGIMNGILSVGTALGASLYNIIGEFVFINPEGKTTINDQFYEFEIANNFKKYISSMDTSNDAFQYYIVVEYAEKRNGKECSPNQLASNSVDNKSESSCTFFYSNINIDGSVINE